jgi:DNA invertase Pin-like site-specific DNA recombinase
MPIPANLAERIISAVGYLRKSTTEDGYEKSIADQKARISEMKPAEPGARYQIIRWYSDPGIPGWKRGHERPDYFRLVSDIRERRDVQAILVDDMDRFSRADAMETQHDVQLLRELGVRFIHAQNQGSIKIAHGEVTAAMQIAMYANASHEHCTRLSRRIASTRRDKAKDGLRSGGPVPYGMADDGAGGLKPGDPKEVEVVQWIFEQIANDLRSMAWIVGDLNRRKVPGPRRGGCWYKPTVARLLRRRCYRGDFTFNLAPQGQFFGIDGNGEVVSRAELDERKQLGTDNGNKVFEKKGAYKPVVDPALFDKAQLRLDVLSKDRSRRKRAGYPLTGILVCDHCGSPMCGMPQRGKGKNKSDVIVYRCTGDTMRGPGTCGNRIIRQNRILPFVLRTLGQEIKNLHAMLTAPPEQMVDDFMFPNRKPAEQRKQLLHDRHDLAAKIDRAEENMLATKDVRTLKSLDARISAMRDELDKLDAALAADGDISSRDATEATKALMTWWDEYWTTALSVPLPPGTDMFGLWLYTDQEAEENAIMVNPLKVNDALHQIGCEVRLRWHSETYTTSTGKTRSRHTLVGGRFRLGQQTSDLPVCVSLPLARGTRCTRLPSWPGSRRARPGRPSTPARR